VGTESLGNSVSCFSSPKKLRPIYEGFGIDIPKSTGEDSFELPIPATYVIDKDLTIRMAFADADYTKRLDPEDVIEKLAEMANAA
jgi:peroxiredoxin